MIWRPRTVPHWAIFICSLSWHISNLARRLHQQPQLSPTFLFKFFLVLFTTITHRTPTWDVFSSSSLFLYNCCCFITLHYTRESINFFSLLTSFFLSFWLYSKKIYTRVWVLIFNFIFWMARSCSKKTRGVWSWMF